MSAPDFQALSAQAETGSTYLDGILRPGKRVVAIEPFNYDVEITQAQNVTNNVTINLDANSDFALYAMSGSVRSSTTSGVNIIPHALLQIRDNGTGKSLFAQPALFGLVTGQNGLPFTLPVPNVYDAFTKLDVLLTTLTQAGGPYIYNLCLLGERIYYAGSGR